MTGYDTVDDILAAATKGRRIAIVADTLTAASGIFTRFELATVVGWTARRTFGEQRLQHTSGGQVRFQGRRWSPSGLHVDVVVLALLEPFRLNDLFVELAPAMALSAFGDIVLVPELARTAEIDVISYRIEYVIQRRVEPEEDFTEIGFGSSGEWATVDQAEHMMSSAIANREWETEPGHPDPSEVDRG